MISSAITLVRLRWTLTLATLRKSAWQTVAYVFSAVLAAGTIIGTGVLAWFIGILPPFTVNADGFPLNILGPGGIVNIVVVLVGATMTIFIGFIQLMMLGEGSTMNPRNSRSTASPTATCNSACCFPACPASPPLLAWPH